MATVYVDTDNYLDLVAYAGIDTITVRYGAILTIRESNTTQPFQITTTEGTIKVTSAYRKLVLAAGGYVNCVAGDVGKTVVGATTGDTGTLVSYDNGTRTWWVLRTDPTDDQFDNAAENISITGGTGAGAMSAAAAQYIIVKFNATNNSGFTLSQAGKLIIEGDWYTLGTGNGAAGQTFTFYGAEACPYIQVETAAGSGVFTDCRCAYDTVLTTYGAGVYLGNVFQHAPDGAIANPLFGDGTNGLAPANGAKVRCPDIYITSAQAYTATRGNRSRVNCNPAGYHDWSHCMFSDRWYNAIYSCFHIDMEYVGGFAYLYISTAANCSFDHVIMCRDRLVADDMAFYISYLSNSTFTDCQGETKGNYYGAINYQYCNDITMTRCTGVVSARTGSASAIMTAGGAGYTAIDCIGIGGRTLFSQGSNFEVTGFRYSDTPTGAKTTSNALHALWFNFASNGRVDDVALLVGGSPPYSGAVVVQASDNILITNVNYNPDTHTGNPLYMSYGSKDCTFSDCSLSGNPRTGNFGIDATVIRPIVRNIMSTSTTQGSLLSQQGRFDGIVSAIPTIAQNGVIDTPYQLIYDSVAKTTGYLCLVFSPPIELSYYTYLAGNQNTSILFNNSGGLYMKSIGDSCEWEIPYLLQGISSFQNVAASINQATWSANCTKEYAIKSGTYGSSWGAWTACTAANLSAEVVDPDIGFYMKFRFTMTGAHATLNVVNQFAIPVNFDPAFHYPVGYVDLELRNLVIGSTYWVWDTTNSRWLGQGTAAATSVVLEVPYDFDGTDVAFQVHVRHGSSATFYKPWHGTGTYDENGAIVFVAQEADTIVTADLTAPITFDIPNKLIIVADSVTTVTVQSLVNAIRDFETDNPDQETFAEVSGKDAVSATAYTGIVLKLTSDWRVQFESRVGPGWTNCTVTGGDLIADNTFGDDPFCPAAFVNMTRGMSTASSLLETGLDVTLTAIERKVDDNQALILTR